MRFTILWPRVIIAMLVAAGAATATFTGAERSGDPRSVVAAVERQLDDIGPVVRRHTFELKGADAVAPADPSRRLYRSSGPTGELLFLEGPAGRSADDIEHLTAALNSTPQQTQSVSVDSAWAELRRIAVQLTADNRRIAEAKALRQLESKPAAASAEDWASRFPDSNAPWRIQEAAEFEYQRAMYTGLASVGTFALVLFGLTVCGSLWRSTATRMRRSRT